MSDTEEDREFQRALQESAQAYAEELLRRQEYDEVLRQSLVEVRMHGTNNDEVEGSGATTAVKDAQLVERASPMQTQSAAAFATESAPKATQRMRIEDATQAAEANEKEEEVAAHTITTVNQRVHIEESVVSAPKTTQRVHIEDVPEGSANVPFAAESAPKATQRVRIGDAAESAPKATAGTAVLDAKASKAESSAPKAPEGSANIPKETTTEDANGVIGQRKVKKRAITLMQKRLKELGLTEDKVEALKKRLDGSCCICWSDFNGRERAPVECPACAGRFCAMCTKAHLLALTTDPRCPELTCSIGWGDEMVDANFSRSFRRSDLHRKDVRILLDREKGMLADVELEAAHRRAQREVREAKTDREYVSASNRLQEVRVALREAGRGVNARDRGEVKREFKQRCPAEGCVGFLSTAWKCGTCMLFSCATCFKLIGADKTATKHKCEKADVESADLIRKDCKNCPSCGVPTFRIMGCNQMWCVACDTAWDWNTQRVINGTIHNPHYHEYLERRRREGRDVAAPRVAGGGPPGGGGTHNDMIVCGDVPNWANNNVLDHVYARFRHTKRHNGYYETAMAVERERRLHECYRHLVELHAMMQTPQWDHRYNAAYHRDLRIKYMAGEMAGGEKQWQTDLMGAETTRKRKERTCRVFEMVLAVAGDMLGQLMEATKSYASLYRYGQSATRDDPADGDGAAYLTPARQQFNTAIDATLAEFEYLRKLANDQLVRLYASYDGQIPQFGETMRMQMTPRQFLQDTLNAIKAGRTHEKKALMAAHSHKKSEEKRAAATKPKPSRKKKSKQQSGDGVVSSDIAESKDKSTEGSAPKATPRVHIGDAPEGSANVPFATQGVRIEDAAESVPKATQGVRIEDAAESAPKATQGVRIEDAAESAPKATEGTAVLDVREATAAVEETTTVTTSRKRKAGAAKGSKKKKKIADTGEEGAAPAAALDKNGGASGALQSAPTVSGTMSMTEE